MSTLTLFTRQGTTRRFLGCLLALILVVGRVPAGAQNPKAPRAQAAAGSAHVAILSVAPWEEYIAALQPNFPMDEARALKESLPDTLRAERQLSDVLGVGVRLALPSVTTNATNTTGSSSNASDNTVSNSQTVGAAVAPTTTTVSTTNGSSTTTTTSSTNTTAPGDVSKVTIGSPPDVPDAPAPEKSVLEGTIGVDPFVRYAAAASLFQEVRMMQRYVRDALVPPGHKAFVVRLQVTLMPAQRKLPLDAYTTLSFVAQDDPLKAIRARDLIDATAQQAIERSANLLKNNPGETEKLKIEADIAQDTSAAQIAKREFDAARARADAETEVKAYIDEMANRRKTNSAGGKEIPKADRDKRRRLATALLRALAAERTTGPDVRVVPLLVSDNIEGAMETNSTAVLRQYGFGLLGLLSNIGLSADINKALQNLKGFVGRDLNSLLTVGQLNDNSLRVRFGAMYQASDVVGLVPRNQTVTLLVVTSTDAKELRVSAKTEFANAGNGSFLLEESRGAFQDRIDKALKRYWINIDETDPALALMVDSVQQSNFNRFKYALQLLSDQNGSADDRAPLETFAESIWLDVASIVAKLPYSATTVTLPPQWNVPDLDASSAVLASDDGKATVVRVPGAGNLRGTDVWATLHLGGIAIPSTSTVFSGSGEVRFEFPSAKAIGLCPKTDSCATGNSLRIFRAYQRWEASADRKPHEVTSRGKGLAIGYRQTAKLSEEEKPTWFTVAIGAGAIVATKNIGSIRIDVTRKDGKQEEGVLSLRFSGGEIVNVWQVDSKGGRTAIAPTKGSYELATSATLVAEFRNLHPTVPVKLVIAGADRPDSYEFKVFEAGEEKKDETKKL